MISNELAEKILDYAMTRGGDYAEIFEEEREYTKIGIAGKETPTILAGQEAGLGVRILKGTKSCYLTFSHPEEGVLFRKMKGALSDWNDRAHIRTFSGKDSANPPLTNVLTDSISQKAAGVSDECQPEDFPPGDCRDLTGNRSRRGRGGLLYRADADILYPGPIAGLYQKYRRMQCSG